MLSLFKTPWSNLAIVLFTFAILNSVLASPFARLDNGSPSSWPRDAPGLADGSPCHYYTDCTSKYCQTDYGSDVGTCERQDLGSYCQTSLSCLSNSCYNGRCVSENGGACEYDYDCLNYGAIGYASVACFANKCMVNVGYPCATDDVCFTGLCLNQVCRRKPQAPSQACDTDAECAAGQCEAVERCADQTGRLVDCDTNSDKHCSRLPLGSKCANDGYCAQGFCRSGICTASKIGDACVSETQCGGTSVCGTTGKCHTPGPNTQYPQAACGADSQCKSTRCITGVSGKDQYGNPVNPPLSVFNQTFCDYFRSGGGPCRSFVDCGSGVCKDSKCYMSGTGGRCATSSNCISPNLCGLDGICYKPEGKQGAGKPCTDASQCTTNTCTQKTFSRPNPDSPGEKIPTVDKFCQQSNRGGSCSVDGDCIYSNCRNNVCVKLDIGQKCLGGPQCKSATCVVDTVLTGSTTKKVCSLISANKACANNSQCYSGQCVSLPSGLSCGDALCDPYYGCQAIGVLGTCRADVDCGVNGHGGQCDVDKKCRRNLKSPCTSSDQCLSRYCVLSNPDDPYFSPYCAPAPASTTTTTTTSASTTTTTTTTTSTKAITTSGTSPTSSSQSTTSSSSIKSSTTTSPSSSTKSSTTTTTSSSSTKASTTTATATKSTSSSASTTKSP
ncbi:hypothetical protein A4X09_0g3563 [Tilletia walkeri]|uniref:Uncharacterized protein n=1 Tax=Tilletia walkeri TaxID=117179 RepID=A0A8X7N943_9BASI|nr:hypothetical protein A4X09_0g3563 [Tilletia walkeri]